MSILHFDEVQVGDWITFTTRDNGFGGTGGDIERTGVVFRKTDKVIDVTVDGGIHVFVNGRNRVENGTARLRKADWYDRSPRAARPRCVCGGRDYASCLCEISLQDFLATSPYKRA